MTLSEIKDRYEDILNWDLTPEQAQYCLYYEMADWPSIGYFFIEVTEGSARICFGLVDYPIHRVETVDLPNPPEDLEAMLTEAVQKAGGSLNMDGAYPIDDFVCDFLQSEMLYAS